MRITKSAIEKLFYRVPDVQITLRHRTHFREFRSDDDQFSELIVYIDITFVKNNAGYRQMLRDASEQLRINGIQHEFVEAMDLIELSSVA